MSSGKSNKKNRPSGSNNLAESDSSSSHNKNKPRNHIITDASKPFTFTYKQYGKLESVIVDQTTNEVTWPGGALWDIGVLLSHVIVGIAPGTTPTKKLPSRLIQCFPSTKDLSILELGCGVGLTGIVAAAALGTSICLLTDLDPVIEQVTIPNLAENSTPGGTSSTGLSQFRFTKAGKRGKIMAMPLCWGNSVHEQAVADTLAKAIKPNKTCRQQKKKKGGKGQHKQQPSKNDTEHATTQPDIILIGDVAYQHKPGAPSHFDVLVSTLLKFLGPHTLVVFGTRMRMPASKDLLLMFCEHMDEIVLPPVPADEIDESFTKFKHNITIHVFRKRKDEPETK